MASERASSIRQEKPRRTGDPVGRDVSDRELLERFLAHRDETAFADLVQRHGRTVWGVCRRVLHRQQDAEDAFQAVFITLARKAESIRKAEAVSCWLYGVAYRVAMKARLTATRRDALEKHAAEPRTEPPAWGEAACRELQRMLDEEVQHLAEKYRAPFVLCCLEGMSKSEAARELGWKEGTVSGRLAQARKLLQERLLRRGVTLSAVLTAGALAQSTASAAPALVGATVKAGAAGHAASSLSPSAVALADSFIKSMTLAKIKAVLSVVVAMTALVGGGALTAHRLGAFRNPSATVERPLPLVEPLKPPLVEPLDEQVLTLAFSPDGKRLVLAGAGVANPGQIRVWDSATGKELLAVKGIPPVGTAAFSPDGETLATGDADGLVRLRDSQTGEPFAMVKAHDGSVNGLAFSPDGAALVTAGRDRKVKLWDRKLLQERKVFLGHGDMVLAAAFFSHGRAVVTCGKDKTARIWDVETGKETHRMQGHRDGIEAVAVSPDGKVIATGSQDRTVRLWDAQTGKEQAILELKRDQSPIIALAFFPPRGDLLASAAGDGAIRLWDVKGAKPIKSLGKHATAVRALAFSPDGMFLAAGGREAGDRPVYLWDTGTWRQRAVGGGRKTPMSKASFSLDGARPASRGDRDVLINVARTERARIGDGEKKDPPGSPDGSSANAAPLLPAMAFGIVSGAVVLASALSLGLFFVVRQSRRAARTPASVSEPDRQADPEEASIISFRCSSCAKALKARARLAGKKVRCSQCSKAVRVPESWEGKPA